MLALRTSGFVCACENGSFKHLYAQACCERSKVEVHHVCLFLATSNDYAHYLDHAFARTTLFDVYFVRACRCNLEVNCPQTIPGMVMELGPM